MIRERTVGRFALMAAILSVPATITAQPAKAPFPLWDGKETVAEYAKRAGLEPTLTLDLGDGVKLEMVLVPAGKLRMGCPDSDKSGNKVERPQHEVTLSTPFYMGKYEVTQGQYRQVTGGVPGGHKGDDLPVHSFWLQDAQRVFFAKVSKITGKRVTLPSEAQWEWACRAGSTTRYCCGDEDAGLDKVAWLVRNSDNKVHQVGQKAPNAWGLYDMHGNVMEFCRGVYYPYAAGPAVDEVGTSPREGDAVLRGGCFCFPAYWARSSSRFKAMTYRGYEFGGIRVIVEVEALAKGG
jgi:formylglycine-generating enzyme required for sulfatase activity